MGMKYVGSGRYGGKEVWDLAYRIARHLYKFDHDRACDVAESAYDAFFDRLYGLCEDADPDHSGSVAGGESSN